MKKALSFIISSIVIISIFGSCTTVYAPTIDPTDTEPPETHELEVDEYLIEYTGQTNLIKEMISNGKAGDEIEIRTEILYDADIELTVNGKKIERSHYDSDYWGFKFVMPEEKVTINVKGVGSKGDGETHWEYNRYDSFIIRVPWKEIDEVASPENCLNFDKLVLDNEPHLPIFKIESVIGCYQLVNSYAYDTEREYASLSQDNSSVTVSDKTYDENFFKDNILLAAYISSGSGSLRYGLLNIAFNDDTICINAEQTNHPEVGTCDMAGWLLIVEIPKNDIIGIENFDAILK